MKLYKKYTSINLILRIFIGLVIGVGFGAVSLTVSDAVNSTLPVWVSGFGSAFDIILTVFGKLFIGALRSIAPVLVFFLISSSLMHAKAKQGPILRKQIIVYIFATLLASLCALVINFLIGVPLVLPGELDLSQYSPPSGIADVVSNLFVSIVSNPIQSIAEGNYLGILFWSILFGFACRGLAGPGLKTNFEQLSDVLTHIVRIIIEFAPFGICGLVYTAVISSGLGIFTDYGMLLGVYLTISFLMFLVVNPIIVFCIIHRNPYPLVLRTMKESALTAFFFRSSAANIPVNLALCKKLHLDESNYSISIPLGSTINMEGAAITIITLTMGCCKTLGIEIEFVPALLMSIIATVSACGASGVSGGSILLVPMACGLFGITGDIASAVVSVGFIIGVVQDSVETALNSSSDVLFTSAVQFADKIHRGVDVHKVVGGTLEDRVD